MKKINFSVISDSLLMLFSVWLISVCALRFVLPLTPAVAAGFLFAFSASSATFFILNHSSEKKSLKKRDAEEKEKLMTHLALTDGKELKDLFGAEKEKAEFIFRIEKVTPDDIISAYKRRGKSGFTICCDSLSPEAEKLCSALKIKTICGEEIYSMLKERAALPKSYVVENIKKRTLKEKLCLALSKTNWRVFFRCGAGLLILSFFTFFKIYYIISGAVFILIAIFIRIFGCRKR